MWESGLKFDVAAEMKIAFDILLPLLLHLFSYHLSWHLLLLFEFRKTALEVRFASTNFLYMYLPNFFITNQTIQTSILKKVHFQIFIDFAKV